MYAKAEGTQSAVYSSPKKARRGIWKTEAARTKLSEEKYYEQFMLTRIFQKQLFCGLFSVKYNVIRPAGNSKEYWPVYLIKK